MATRARLKVSPVLLSLFSNAVQGVCDEMLVTIKRTGRSALAKELLDFSTGLLNVRGELLASGLENPAHMAQVHAVMAVLFEKHPIPSMNSGDVFVINDPYTGGTHLPDIFLIKPVFWEGQCIAFSCSCIHHVDIGGIAAGGNSSHATEIYQEGLRIPPLGCTTKACLTKPFSISSS